MNNDQQVSDGRSPHMGTTSTDAVIKNIGCQGCRSNPRWLELAHRLGLTRRKLKKVVKSGPASLTTCYWMLHVGYYGALTVSGTVCLWWCRGKETVTFVDCLFNAVSALTNTGLSSVLLRDFTPPGLLVLTLLMFLGHAVFVSLLPVYLHRFHLSHHNQPLTVATDLVSSTNGEAPQILVPGDGPGDGVRISCSEIRSETSLDLERQALVTLSWLVPVYMTVFLCFGFVAVVCYISFNGPEAVGAMNPILTAMFLSVSAFSNTGLSPLDENMVPFAGSPLVLGPVAALILAGNCMFPPTLRFTIWGLSMVSDEGNVYKYLLQCPRRCYSLLFPQAQTTWLVATVVAFNVVDLVAFCSLEWRSGGGGAGVKLMDGLFQSLNTRSAGMNVLQLSSLSPPLLVLYTAMMGVAAYPVFLSRQQSRVARTDGNLHQYSDPCEADKLAPADAAAAAAAAAAADEKLSLQFRKLFTRDSATIFVHLFLICTVEIRSINSDPLNFTMFSIFFEVISAYGNVGLSLGYSCQQWVRASANTPHAQAAAACRDAGYSFSGKWRAGSKLVLVGVMLAGRHRSLPADMDYSISIAPTSSLCSVKTFNPLQ